MGKEIRVLGVDGKLIGRHQVAMTEAQIAEAMRLMLLSRAIDDRVTRLQRLGRAGVYGPVHGQEAAVVGSGMALRPDRDWIVPASREQPAMVRHGLPLDRLLAGYMGRLDHARIPDGVRLLPRQSSIATQLPHAAGLAWALKLRREEAVVIVYFGEGAASEGDFHEAANLAGVMRVPLVLVLLNNQWAISTPASRQTAATSLAARAEGYGFGGVAVDGNDLFAVHLVTRAAVAKALAGGGPTLIEARTYRIGFHNTTDNPREYREEAEVEAAAKRDPIERVRRYGAAAGFWTAARHQSLIEEVAADVEAAYRKAEAAPRPGPAAVFEHVFAEVPPRLARQREAALRRAAEPA